MKPRFTNARPQISIEDAQTAHVWGLTLDAWYTLSDWEKKRHRETMPDNHTEDRKS